MTLPLNEISQIYGLNLKLVERVARGFRSSNYVLADGAKRYFLKKHQSAVQADSVSQAEQFFAAGDVPVILSVDTKQGQAIFHHAGAAYSLYPFVNGRHLERGGLTRSAAISLGSTLVTLHKRGKSSTLTAAEQFRAWDTKEFLADFDAIEAKILAEQPRSDFGMLALQSIRLKKQAVLERPVTYEQLELASDHLIHGDYFCDNVFFDGDDKVSHVFDFERVQYAPPMYELFRSMFVTFFTIPNQKNVDHAKHYVDAYLAAYPFPKEVVKRSLVAAYQRQIHSLWIEGGHYLDNSNRMDSLLRSQYDCARYYIANRADIEAYLLS